MLYNQKFKMTSIENVQDLASLAFEPHKLGNYGNYGLNFFGSSSIIQYQDHIWRFCYYSENDAVYESAEGLICRFNEREMPTRSDIKRMQVANFSLV